jgi:hypothetical protein
MLIALIALCAWIAVLALVAALSVAAARGDEAIACGLADDGDRPAPEIVLLEWSGAPLLAAAGGEAANARLAVSSRR